MDATRLTLLQRIRDCRDEAGWNEFVEIYRPLVKSYARRFGADEQEAEDAVQDVFGTVVRRIHDFERRARPGSFRAWLRKVTASKVRRMLVRRAHQPVAVGGSDDLDLLALPDPSKEQDEIWEREWENRKMEVALRWARGAVKPKTWRAFEILALEGRKAEEAAGELGMDVGMVYVCKSRVLQRIRSAAAELNEE